MHSFSLIIQQIKFGFTKHAVKGTHNPYNSDLVQLWVQLCKLRQEEFRQRPDGITHSSPRPVCHVMILPKMTALCRQFIPSWATLRIFMERNSFLSNNVSTAQTWQPANFYLDTPTDFSPIPGICRNIPCIGNKGVIADTMNASVCQASSCQHKCTTIAPEKSQVSEVLAPLPLLWGTAAFPAAAVPHEADQWSPAASHQGCCCCDFTSTVNTRQRSAGLER